MVRKTTTTFASQARIVLVRMRHDPRTRAYVERRRAEGRTTGEIIRCLKRYVARDVYRHLPRTAAERPRSGGPVWPPIRLTLMSCE